MQFHAYVRLLGGLLGYGLFAASVQANEPAQVAPLVIENLRMLDPAVGDEDVEARGTLVIVDGRIAYAGEQAAAPEIHGAVVIDATGLTATPGLVDMHVHVWDETELAAYLAAGITTVRNMSGMPFHLDLARRIEAGELAGPRLETTGPILNSPGPNAQINHQMVTTADEARAAVAAQQDAGYTRLKIYSNLTRAAYEAMLDEAHRRGMRVTGHTPEGERLDGMPFERDFLIGFAEILDDGFETIEHSESIVWHGLRENFDPAAGRLLAERIAASGSAVTPTLVAHRNLVRVARTKGEFAQRSGMDKLNPVTQSLEAENIAVWAARDPSYGERAGAFYARFTGMMHDAGVLLVAGSDAGIFTNIPGESLFDEFDLLAESGLAPLDILRTGTANPAIVLGREGTSGCLATGCEADLVFYACDPLAKIDCLRRPQAVVRAGRWLDRAALDALDEAATRHDPQRTITNLAAGMAAQGTPLDPSVLGQ